ncbi:MAG: T9SS type A sorting domain-containing protein [Ignavibacteria bacterium]|nr:T9SS type A sorting domain-containing protein [Ignavibacteria bacterium]
MKKPFLTIFIYCVLLNLAFAQNYNWITPNKTYLKMYLADDGMYRINQSDFTAAGVTTGNIDPRTVKLYNKGNQLPVFFSGESDGVFDAADYFDFYGTRNYGGLTTTYDQNNVFAYSTNEYFNLYSDTNVYWVEWGGSNGLRYSVSTYSSVTAFENQYHLKSIHLEKDYFYTQGENINASDYRFLNTEKFKGEGWFWSSLSNTQTLSDTFSLPLLYSVPQTSSVKLFTYPTARNLLVTNEHSLQVKINGTLISTLYSNDFGRIDTTVTFSSSLLSSVSVNTVSVTYGYTSSPSYPTSNMLVDFMEVQYPERFSFRNNLVSSSPGGGDTLSRKFSISGYNSANPVNIYDVTNFVRINTFTNVVDTLKFTGKRNGNFQLVNNSITKKPFRIKQKTVPDLVSTSNGADYLVVYNKLFTSPAEQLRAYRQSHDGFRSFKAEIEDIYDIYNYGLENPVALRNFTKYIYDNWQLPKLSYICLLGRGSLDPKKILSTSSYNSNLIPVYGFPPSDGYFANVNIGSFFYYDMIAIGRLPAYYVTEAQSMVDKIISFESQNPGYWSKCYTFITGGGTAAEQSQHQSKSNSEISTYITPPSLSGEAHKIYRSDVSGVQTFNMKDSIINDLNRGIGFVNFRGHAGSHDWEVALDDPDLLNNGTKLPIILSLTCFTGENSKSDYRGFGERFLYLNNKGAIAFVGTTGWSYAQQGNDFGTHIVNTLKFDTTRRAGDLTKYANKKMSADSLSFNVRHTVNCYSLLGDPAVKLKIPVRPEFSLTNADYKLSNDFPAFNEKVVLTVYPKNYGLNADSCKIRFNLKRNNQSYLVIDTVRKNIGHKDSVNFGFYIDSLGSYSFSVTLDFDNFYPLENKSDNSISVVLPVMNSSFVILRPVNNESVSADSIEFTGLNPQLDAIDTDVKIVLQIDTSVTFTSPLCRTFLSKSISGVTTKFKTDIPVRVNNKSYYYRTNFISNYDSTGWTKYQTFTYNTVSDVRNENNESDSPSGKFKPAVTVFKNKVTQYAATDFDNTLFDQSGIRLYDYTGNLFIRSLGNNAEESSYFSVGNKNIYIDGSLNSGLNMLKVRKLTGSIIETKNLKMNTTASSDSLITFLNTFDTTQYLMLLNAAYFQGGTTLSANAKTKLRQFGSIYCDSIGILSYFHTWSLIGYLGANSSQTSEMFDPCCRPAPGCVSCDHWTESVSNKTVNFKKPSGTVSSVIGPAQAWQSFSWTQTLNPNTSIKYDVYGIDKNNLQTLILSNVTTNTNTDLSSVNAFQYPKLLFVAKLIIDTASGSVSPVLNSLSVKYFAPAELVSDISSLDTSSSYIIGDEFKFNFNLFNSGSYDIPGIITNVYKMSQTAANLILTDTASSPVTMDNFVKCSNKFRIPPFRDSMKVIIEYKPKGAFNETFTYNNILQISLKNAHFSNSNAAIVSIYSDGKLIKNGDNLRKKPEIKISVSASDKIPEFQSDTSDISLKLNDIPVYRNVSSVGNPMTKSLNSDIGRTQGDMEFMFYPELKNGTNRLAVIYNLSGEADSAVYDVIVSDFMSVINLYNFPNPMKGETNFIFELTGNDIPQNFSIKIYTVSGKLIKELEYPVSSGYNQIPWDGKDSDGEVVANGTYLYKVSAEGDTEMESEIQKLVVLR